MFLGISMIVKFRVYNCILRFPRFCFKKKKILFGLEFLGVKLPEIQIIDGHGQLGTLY